MLLSERLPALYPVSVAAHRATRRIEWVARRDRPPSCDRTISTEYSVARHSSPIYRRLAGVDMRLQENKRTNISLAIARLDDRVLLPNQQLSFWRCVGPPSARRGFLAGLVLENGRVSTDVGGGLCQLSNLLYWLVLHSPLEVTERHHHGYDVFPDSGRVLPFGSGATVFYNYVDLRFRNPTELRFRLKLWLTDEELHGQLKADRLPRLAYHVREEGHRFYKAGGRWFRENRIYQIAVDRQSGREEACRLVAANRSPVMYAVNEMHAGDEALVEAPVGSLQ